MIILSPSPLTFARAQPVSTTSVIPSNPQPDNCHTVILFNNSATAALIGIGTPGAVLAAGISATTLPAGASLTLSLGTMTARGIMDTGRLPGSGLIYASAGAFAVTVEITYLSAFGPI